MFLVRNSFLAALLFAHAAHAQVGCTPNPNLTPALNNPPGYVNGCGIPAAAINNPSWFNPMNQTLNLSGAQLGPYFPNNMLINTDTVAVPGAAFLTGWSFTDQFGGASATGGRQALQGVAELTAPTSPSNALRSYVGGTFLGWAKSADNGTGLAINTAAGAVFGINPYFITESGAVNLKNATGGEVNSIAKSGSSMYYKSILQLVGGGALDAVQGTVYDTMLSLSDQPSDVGHKSAILIGEQNGQFPVVTGGSLLTLANSNGSLMVTEGLDISGITVSDCAFKAKLFSACQNSVSIGLNTAQQNNIFNALSNAASTYPTSATTTYSLSTNFSNSARELDIWNDDTAATNTFVIYQKTGASAATAVLQGNTTALTAPGLIVTSMPTQAHAGGNACVGYNSSTQTLYISSTVTTC